MLTTYSAIVRARCKLHRGWKKEFAPRGTQATERTRRASTSVELLSEDTDCGTSRASAPRNLLQKIAFHNDEVLKINPRKQNNLWDSREQFLKLTFCESQFFLGRVYQRPVDAVVTLCSTASITSPYYKLALVRSVSFVSIQVFTRSYSLRSV